ncbi:flagellar hook-associated protein FlgL [Thalassobacillus sp. CUG 92003]|uniref:flagellar hook-associated protein FlgL n=1 Tax=Thalassobacillus sp. CUG 92003 TaxID=2736641 RepID=UPI0015E7C9A3|nr:flagellar hook-associated protein FlgL [Thalassobacillus sp. CUG 92003]
MRVTQGMLSNNMLRNISNSYERMGKQMEQLSTGKKISRPSDDPIVAMKGMNYRSQVNEIEQYKRNIGEVHNWMDNSDDSLDKATKAMQRLRELTVQASNDSYEEGQRENIAEEVDQLREHMEDIANTKVNNKYIFNGTNTNGKPVDLENGDYPTNSEDVSIEVSDGISIKANVNGADVFTEDMFNDMEAFSNALKDGQSGEELDDYVTTFDNHTEKIINERAGLGARMNRVELIEDRLGSQEITANRVLSDNEDVDMEKVITELKTQESVHRAALGAGSRIIQPTLMDFLR